MVARRSQPFHEFVLVAQRTVIRVVAIEKRDADHIIGDPVHGIQVAEDEAAAATVAAEHRLNFVLGEELLHCGNDLGDLLVPVLLSPGRPALATGFEIHHDDHALFEELAQEAGLGADVLNVVMPVIAGLHDFADGLVGGVAIGQGVEDEQNLLPSRKGGLRPGR